MKITKFEKYKDEKSNYKGKFSFEAKIPYRIQTEKGEIVNKDVLIIGNDLSFYDNGTKQHFSYPNKKIKKEDGKYEKVYDYFFVDDSGFNEALLKVVKEYYLANK